MIKNYIIYNNDNVITQFVRCSSDEINRYEGRHLEVDFDSFVFDPNMIYRVDKDRVIKSERSDDEYINNKKKEIRRNKVKNIRIEHKNIVYQGDEESQNRMNRAINSLKDEDTILWKANDNSINEITKNDLIEILALSVKKQTELWFL
jgi:hypothetical protein